MPSEFVSTASCRDVADRLWEYLEDEVGPLDRVRISMHIAACPRCSREMAALARLIHAMHRLRVRHHAQA